MLRTRPISKRMFWTILAVLGMAVAVASFGVRSNAPSAEAAKITIKVKEGEDAAELANQAIADGILPANCVLRVGEDGKTTYVCDPEPAPTTLG